MSTRCRGVPANAMRRRGQSHEVIVSEALTGNRRA